RPADCVRLTPTGLSPHASTRTSSTMPRVTYISQDQKATTLDIPVGTSVMQAAVLHGIDGIVAECGGSCMCATCHVYVQGEQQGVPPARRPDEDAMIQAT